LPPTGRRPSLAGVLGRAGTVGLLLVVMLHCSYLYYAGLQVVAGVKQSAAAEYVGIVLFLALVASTLLGAALAGIGGA
jgi:hypothetical protein